MDKELFYMGMTATFADYYSTGVGLYHGVREANPLVNLFVNANGIILGLLILTLLTFLSMYALAHKKAYKLLTASICLHGIFAVLNTLLLVKLL